MADMDEVHIEIDQGARTWGGAMVRCWDHPGTETRHFIEYTPARANAEKMLEALKLAHGSYCKDQCLWRNDLDKHTPECLEMQSIIAAAEGRGDGE